MKLRQAQSFFLLFSINYAFVPHFVRCCVCLPSVAIDDDDESVCFMLMEKENGRKKKLLTLKVICGKTGDFFSLFIIICAELRVIFFHFRKQNESMSNCGVFLPDTDNEITALLRFIALRM